MFSSMRVVSGKVMEGYGISLPVSESQDRRQTYLEYSLQYYIKFPVIVVEPSKSLIEARLPRAFSKTKTQRKA